MKSDTSRSRYDEARRFTGVYQQMGRVQLDSDWNEEVAIRTQDARRRSQDLAEGAPSDGFLCGAHFVADRIEGPLGWTPTGLPPGDLRLIPQVLRADRWDSESLPLVLRATGVTALRRQSALNFAQVQPQHGPALTPTELLVQVRFESPANLDESGDLRLLFRDGSGNSASFNPALGSALPEQWTALRVPLSALGALDLSDIVAWGITGIAPRTTIWIGHLLLGAPSFSDFVVRGGNGSLESGRILVQGVRGVLPRDLRYQHQPDLPQAPDLSLPLATNSHWVLLDLWETLVTDQDDEFLHEAALDGLDTTTRRRLVQQVRVIQDQSERPALPAQTGGSRLWIPAEGSLTDRYPSESEDPCRDRCLHTENATTGDGYVGGQNHHFRVEVLRVDELPVLGWCRQNGARSMPLVRDANAGATSLYVDPVDAQSLAPEQLISIEDRGSTLQPELGQRMVRRVLSVDAATGQVQLHPLGVNLTQDPSPLSVGGGLDRKLRMSQGARLRVWDGVDWGLPEVRYNLVDGLNFRFGGESHREGDWWSTPVRVNTPDGAPTGWVDPIPGVQPHGPVHHFTWLARAFQQNSAMAFEDLRTRYLPLPMVRDRLIELGQQHDLHAFTLLVGDGENSFGQLDQDLASGVTGDEALQQAVDKVQAAGGGTILLLAGSYRLEHPVVISGASRLTLLGEGDATEIRVVGQGGAFLIDRCGAEGAVTLREMRLIEAPAEPSLIGRRAEAPPESPALSKISAEALSLSEVSGSLSDEAAWIEAWAKGGRGRAFDGVLATLRTLRRLQHENPGVLLEDIPAAKDLLSALGQLPHGVITVNDSENVSLEGLRLRSRVERHQAAGVFLSGRVQGCRIQHSSIEAPTGIAAVPFGPHLSLASLAKRPVAGLVVSDLSLNDLDLRGSHHGILLSDGRLSGVRVQDCTLHGFATGVVVAEELGLGHLANDAPVEIRRCQVSGALLGLDLQVDEVEVQDVHVRLEEPRGAVCVGVRVQGRSARLQACQITLPTQDAGVLGLIAGFVVGSWTQEQPGQRATQGIELQECSVQGNAEALHHGVLIGGPLPARDLRISGCTFQDLGGSAIRAFGHGAPKAELRIESNLMRRIGGVHLPEEADLAEAVARFTDGRLVAGKLRDEALLKMVLADGADELPLLEATLRWVSCRSWRGAIVLVEVDQCWIQGNQLLDIGSASGAMEERVAGIALIGGRDHEVHGNRIDGVFGPARRNETDPGTAGSELPRGAQLLDDLSAAETGPVSVDEAITHRSASGLWRSWRDYTELEDSGRARLLPGLRQPTAAMVKELDRLSGRGQRIASALQTALEELESGKTRAQRTSSAQDLRAWSARAAAFTSKDDLPLAAWTALAEFDEAIDDDLTQVAKRLQDELPALTEGLSLGPELEEALAATLREPTEKSTMASSELLYRNALLQDRKAYSPGRKNPPVGTDATVLLNFASRLIGEVDGLSDLSEEGGLARMEALREERNVVLATLETSNPELGRQLDVDWRTLERPGSIQDKETRSRLSGTLDKVSEWAAGKTESNSKSESQDGAREVELGRAALVGITARHLSGQVELLRTEPEGTRTRELSVLSTALTEFAVLLQDDKEATTLLKGASKSLSSARKDVESRARHLSDLRAYLENVRRHLRTPPQEESSLPTHEEDRVPRLAALAELTLSLPDLQKDARLAVLDRLEDHIAKAADIAGVGNRQTQSYTQAVETLRTRWTTQTSTQRDRELVALAVVSAVDEMARRSGTTDSSDRVLRALTWTATLACNPDESESDRVLQVHATLRERSEDLSVTVRTRLEERTKLSEIKEGLEDALGRLALGERSRVDSLPEPTYDITLGLAEGMVLANCQGRNRVLSNRVSQATRGVRVQSPDLHPIVPVGSPGLLLELRGNALESCASDALTLDLGSASDLLVSDNLAVACSGIASPGEDALGQAVLRVRGEGHLQLRGNTLRDNGHETEHAILHGVLVDWRGELSLQDNVLRHEGGPGGGAGLLLVAEDGDLERVQQLTRAPFLGLEPPPKAAPKRKLGVTPIRTTALMTLQTSATRAVSRFNLSAPPARSTPAAAARGREYLAVLIPRPGQPAPDDGPQPSPTFPGLQPKLPTIPTRPIFPIKPVIPPRISDLL